MKSVLRNKVLVLNRQWQLVNEMTVKEAINRIAAGTCTPLDIPSGLKPVTWEEWVNLPILNDKECIHTAKGRIRMPTVIVAVKYEKVPKRAPKFTLKNIAKRDNYRDQYTGEILEPHEWSMDHVDPKSRNGADAPENVVLTSKKNNNLKGNRTPEEMGWKRPKIKKLGLFQPDPTHPDHNHFVIETYK